MNCNMALDICQNQLQLENSQAEDNGETEAKIDEIFKSVTHVHEVNEDSSDESSTSICLPGREMSVLQDLSVIKEEKCSIIEERPDISTIPVGNKKDSKKDTSPEEVESKMPPSNLSPKLVEETKKDVSRNISYTESCKVAKDKKDAVKTSPKSEEPLMNGSTLVKEQQPTSYVAQRHPDAPKHCTKNDNGRISSAGDSKDTIPCCATPEKFLESPYQCTKNELPRKLSNSGFAKLPEETSNRPKLDDIFPNLVEGSTMDLICEPTCGRVVTEKVVNLKVPEERIMSASLIPAKKARVEIPKESTVEENQAPKNEASNHALDADPEVMDVSIPVLSPPPTTLRDLREIPASIKTSPSETESKVAKTEKNVKNVTGNTPTAKKEEKVISAEANVKCPAASSSSKKQKEAPVQEKKVNKPRLVSKPNSPLAVHQKIPPKESMLAGGECFAAVEGIETRSSVAGPTQRRSSNIAQQRGREANLTRPDLSKHLNKLRNNKNWKKKHMFIAGSIGIAMICFYAYYKNKT